MFVSRLLAGAFVASLLLASVGPAAAATGSGSASAGEAYAGSHVSFETSANAVTDYAVDGETMLSTVKVQSASEAEGGGLVDVGASLSAVTSLEGADLSLSASTSTSATVDTEGSASLDAHDNGHGVLVVRTGGEEHYATADLGDGAEARATGDGRVTVATAAGVEGTFVLVGDGEVTVNDEGDVAARLGEDGRLVFRAYPAGKSDDDATQEQLIANGTAAAEIHVMTEAGEPVTDTIAYGSATAVRAEQSASDHVEVTVDRAAHEGKVIIATVSESALDTAGDLSVEVDGRAAAEASSYGELEGAIGSDQSKYLVRQSAAAEGSTQVLVAVNHFSERTVTMSEADDDGGTATDVGGDGSPTDDPGSRSDGGDAAGSPISAPGQPGFGVSVAVGSVLAAALLARRRR